jgi:prolyl 4-hydroxylase
MDHLVDLIKVYENALDGDICDFLIDYFETSKDFQEKVECNRKPNFTQINLTQHKNKSKDVEDIHQNILKVVLRYKEEYYTFIHKECFPESNSFEEFRIKRYIPNSNEAFDTHVDVKDYESSRRFLSFMFYLNDVDGGGKTCFKDLTIIPKKGKLVVFPPLWMYPHYGEEPKSNKKYILSTYLHYKNG